MTPPKIELRGVSKTFSGEDASIEALHDVSFEVNVGEFATILGPSGCGKSSIFNMIVGLLEPDKGEICIDGEVCDDRIGRVGYMPQRDLLLPWRSVMDNLILSQDVRGIPRTQSYAQAERLLPLFDLEAFTDVYPSSLSGGMRQRAALLRTMLTDRNTLLLDEPFGALDALTRRELQDWLLGVWRQFNLTILFITHDVEEAIYLGDRVLVLSPRPGRVVKTLDVQLPRPRKQSMIADPMFGAHVAELLEALGVDV